jgi:hypothetical protein
LSRHPQRPPHPPAQQPIPAGVAFSALYARSGSPKLDRASASEAPGFRSCLAPTPATLTWSFDKALPFEAAPAKDEHPRVERSCPVW